MTHETERPKPEDFGEYGEYKRAYDRWRSRDPERQAKNRAWYAANREAVLEQKKVYFQENKEQIRDYQRDYVRDRYHVDPEFRAKSIERAKASNKANPERVRANSKRWRADPDNKRAQRAKKIAYRDENRDQIDAQRALFRAENRELLAERQREWYAKNLDKARASMREYGRENRAKLVEQARQRREADPEWAAHLDAYRKEYYKENRHKFIAQNALREERIRHATPPWLTKEQRLEMELVYRNADELTALTGVRHEVDHIWPIKGRKSCGLHVPWNLQVITWKENNRKRAREPDE